VTGLAALGAMTSLVLACQFDPTGTSAGGDDDDLQIDLDAAPGAPDARPTPDAEPPDAGPPCPAGWTEGDFGCYVEVVTPRAWSDAQARCMDLGGYLTEIDSAEENQWLRDNLQAPFELWIGLSDRAVEGDFRWIDGSALDFTDWDLFEPNDANGSEDCVELRVDGTGFADGWNDQDCAEERDSICERDKQ
jgi:hypothetical protein